MVQPTFLCRMELLISQAKVYHVMQHLIVQGPIVPVSIPAQNNVPRNHLQGPSVSLLSTQGNHLGTPLQSFSAPNTSPSFQSVITPRQVPSFSLKVMKADVHRIGKKIDLVKHSMIRWILLQMSNTFLVWFNVDGDQTIY